MVPLKEFIWKSELKFFCTIYGQIKSTPRYRLYIELKIEFRNLISIIAKSTFIQHSCRMYTQKLKIPSHL